jgi:hypothetical protein
MREEIDLEKMAASVVGLNFQEKWDRQLKVWSAAIEI